MEDLKLLESIEWRKPEIVEKEGDIYNGWLLYTGTMEVCRKTGSIYTLGVSAMIDPKNVTLSILDLLKESEPKSSAITCCFICDQPLVQGKTRKLWTEKGRYQYTCTNCVTRDQDLATVQMRQK